MTLQELRNEPDRTRSAWEAVDLDGLYGFRKRNVHRPDDGTTTDHPRCRRSRMNLGRPQFP